MVRGVDSAPTTLLFVFHEEVGPRATNLVIILLPLPSTIRPEPIHLKPRTKLLSTIAFGQSVVSDHRMTRCSSFRWGADVQGWGFRCREEGRGEGWVDG